MLVIPFGKKQYQHLPAFIEHMSRLPEIKKYGTVIIRPEERDIIKFEGIKERLDSMIVDQVLVQICYCYDGVILPSAEPKVFEKYGAEFFAEGSCDGRRPEKKLVEFLRFAQKENATEYYAADLEETFTKNHEYLDMQKLALSSALKYDPAFQRKVLTPGIHDSFTYLGRSGTVAPLHLEDQNMGSMNVMLWAEDKAVKIWIAVGTEDRIKCLNRLRLLEIKAKEKMEADGFEEIARNTFCCEASERGKNIFVTMDQFEDWMTNPSFGEEPFDIFIGRQEPGDLVVTFPGSWHQVYNSGEFTKLSFNSLIVV